MPYVSLNRKQKNVFYSVILFFLYVPFFGQTLKVDSLLKEIKPQLQDTTKLRIYRELAAAYASVDQEKKYYYAVKYKAIAKRLKVDSLVVEAYIDMGGSHAIRSMMDSAFYYFSRAYKSAEDIGYKRGMARSMINMGYVYEKIDQVEQAIEKYKEALALCNKINYTKGINQCYINIGGIYHELGEYKMALTYFQLANKSYNKTGFESGIAASLYSMATVSVELKEIENAKRYFEESLKIRKKTGNLSGIALATWGLARIDIIEGKYQEALPKLETALKLNIELKNTFNETAVLVSFSRAYIGLKNYQEAKKYATRAYHNSIIMKSMFVQSNVVWVFMQIEEEQGNYKKAFKYQRDYHALRDSIKLENKLKDVVVTEFKRVNSENEGLTKSNKIIQTENINHEKTILTTVIILVFVVILLVLFYKRNLEKKATNLLLKKQRDEIVEINKELESLNEEVVAQMEITAAQNKELEQVNKVKNKFFSIVSHDLRSPIATLKMLFGLHKQGHLNNDELNNLLTKFEETIYSTSAFLDNLLHWSKSQLDGIVISRSEFDISNLVDENAKLVETAIRLKGIKLEINIEPNTKAFADVNMINVVVNNLISNAMKFCDTGDAITVEAHNSKGKMFLSITDNGPGISKENLENLFDLEHTITTSTSGEKGHHIGLVLCKDMIEQNNGEIKVESEDGKGTTFLIELPELEF